MITSGIHSGLRYATQAPSREASEPVILVVDDDWRTRDFVCTVLKYSIGALVIESSHPEDALVLARGLGRRTGLLISNVELAGAKTGMDLAREMVAGNASIKVLLLSGRELAPRDLPAAWRFLSIPFPTAAFLNCVNELCNLHGVP
jgi:FixJ family two-component response regulator